MKVIIPPALGHPALTVGYTSYRLKNCWFGRKLHALLLQKPTTVTTTMKLEAISPRIKYFHIHTKTGIGPDAPYFASVCKVFFTGIAAILTRVYTVAFCTKTRFAPSIVYAH